LSNVSLCVTIRFGIGLYIVYRHVALTQMNVGTRDENDTEISRTEPQSFSTFNPIEFVFCGQKRILNSKTKYGIHNSEFGTKSVWAFVRSISTFLH
jgi:hypothetical protein